MPRFQADFQSTINETPVTQHRRQPTTHFATSSILSASNTTTTPIQLSCKSPDSSYVHILFYHQESYYIDSHKLPILDDNDTQQYNDNDDKSPQFVRTLLPQLIQESLKIGEPVELLCVEGETMRRDKHADTVAFPRLTFYTGKSVFMIQISYSTSASPIPPEYYIEGQVTKFEEPFESYLLNVPVGTDIIRIRSAPLMQHGCNIIYPATSMAMLTGDANTESYALVIYHATGRLTVPVEFSFEETSEGGDYVVDFCFASSKSLSLLSSLGVMFVRDSGEIMTASPISFDGAVVPRKIVEETMDYFRDTLATLSRSDPQWRKNRAAQQFFLDMFSQGGGGRGTEFVKTTLNKESALWPIKVQCAVLSGEETIYEGSVFAIETFGDSEMVGVCIASNAGAVDFALLSPTAFTPRFAFETMQDSAKLDYAASQMANWVECVRLPYTDRSVYSMIKLLHDPQNKQMVHYALPTHVCTVSTNAINVACKMVMEGIQDAVKTKTWMGLSTTSERNKIHSVVVTSGVSAGHNIVARLADGTFASCNVSETQIVHEMASIDEPTRADKVTALVVKDSESAKVIEATQPFYEVIKPVVEELNNGLEGMRKVVGSRTKAADITPELLAVAMKTKDRCAKEVFLPLLKLSELVNERRDQLRRMLKSQMDQLAVLRGTVDELKKRTTTLDERVGKVEANGANLYERSMNLHKASQDLCPTISKAEYDFFQFMRLMVSKTGYWDAQLAEFKTQVDEQCSALAKSQAMMDKASSNESEFIANSHSVLNAQKTMLRATRESLDRAQNHTQVLMQRYGFEAEDIENVDSNAGDPK